MAAFLIVALYFVCFTESRVLPDAGRVRRETAPSIPQVNTTGRLKELRALMQNQAIKAYIVPSMDAHMSEYVAPHFQRRQYISGFTGSRGDAVVTMNKSAMWTDGRYFLQANMQMDDNWALMKLGQPGTPTRAEWLGKVLSSGDKVGIDPNLVSITDYKEMEQELSKYGILLTPVGMNLIDEIWKDRPPLSTKQIYPLGLEFTGEKWQDKVKKLRDAMSAKQASVIVLYKLDEVAWILNLRGDDVPSNPFFFAFVVISDSAVIVYVSSSKVTDAVRTHLSVGKCSDMCAELNEYNFGDMMGDIQALASGNGGIIWLNPYASYGLTSGISDDKLLIEDQPVALWKSVKNPTEIQGMKNANLKDNTAMMQFMYWLKNEVAKGSEDLTEMSASDKLEEFKSAQKDYMGYSFATIAGFGPNGAIIHYRATNATNLRITDKSTFLVDTGSQFKDGTTDTTRTFHFGEPTAKEKDAYTRVLKGQIDLALTVFPNTTQGRFLDPIARKELWGNGLDYRHGTGHGIGMFLSVHEGPQRISVGCPKPWEKPIVPGMFQSDEPGYYEDGVFGIRLETVVVAVPAKTTFTFNDVQYVTFESVSFVPYEKKLIDLSLLTKTELDWLNDYHKQCRDKVGPLLMSPGDEGAREYLMELTEPIGVESTKATASSLTVSCVTLLLTVAMFVAVQ